MLRILHLSDPHLRSTDPPDRDRTLRALLRTLGELRDAGRGPELILLSGDLVDRPEQPGGEAGAAYEVVGRFLDLLLAACGDLPRERLFIVPGNHDVDRRAGRRLQRSLRDAADAQVFFGADPQERALHRAKLAAYEAFYLGYFGAGTQSPQSQVSPLDQPAQVVEIGGRSVGVATLCSAWFSQDDADREQLWIGESTVAAAGAALVGADLRVALCHHGLEWLHPLDRQGVQGGLRAFDVLCHGHVHGLRPAAGAGLLALGAGCCHRSPVQPTRAFLLDVDLDEASRGALVTPLHHLANAERWQREDTDLYGTEAEPVRFTLRPGTAPAAPSRARTAPAADPADTVLRRYLSALVKAADGRELAFRHPIKGTPLLLSSLYVELCARSSGAAGAAGGGAPVHGWLAQHRRALLHGDAGGGKSATAWHVCGQLARHALGMPSAASTYGYGRAEVPVPLLLDTHRLPVMRGPKDPNLLMEGLIAQARAIGVEAVVPDREARSAAVADREARSAAVADREARSAAVADREAQSAAVTDSAQRSAAPFTDEQLRDCFLRLLRRTDGPPALLMIDGAAADAKAVADALQQLLQRAPRARVVFLLPPQPALVLPDFVIGTIEPLALRERTALVDRWVQGVHEIPIGMTIDGSAAAVAMLMHRVTTEARTAPLAQHPLLLHGLCWVGTLQGLPEQRAEVYATCLGALCGSQVRRSPEEVADLVDELAQQSPALAAFRMAQALDDRPDVWAAMRPLLDEPSSYEALRLLSGLQVRRAPEHGTRLLRGLLSEVGAQPERRAQLVGLAAGLIDEMAPYQPDRQVSRRVQEELQRVLAELSDRQQRTPLPARVVLAEGLGIAGDPRVPLDLLDPATSGRVWVDLPRGSGQPPLGILRYPLTWAQLEFLARAACYEPAPDPTPMPVPLRELWRQRALEQPNYPATLLSWDDALFVCRYLTQADWRYRYDLPTEGEWERAVRHGQGEARMYPWGNGLDPALCNIGKRVGRTTPVGVFPGGTAAEGQGCADLVGNVWQWCQSEYDDDPTYIDSGGVEELLAGLPLRGGGKVARGGSWSYMRAGVMRMTFSGGRSDEVGLRLVRRSR